MSAEAEIQRESWHCGSKVWEVLSDSPQSFGIRGVLHLGGIESNPKAQILHTLLELSRANTN